jgi:hypothetical protein
LQHHALVRTVHISWSYTTFLNIAFAVLSLVLIFCFAGTGGPKMLRVMSIKQNGHADVGIDHHSHTGGSRLSGD